MNSAFLYHSLRRDISNFSLIKHRSFDGFLISMHQSGTHWLKHMLATGLTHKFDLPPPRYIHANDVIANPKVPLAHRKLPHIVNTHSIPHMLLGSRLFRQFVKLPPYVVLVRDIRATLVSNFEKWKMHYDCDFNTFLHGDTSGRRFNNDIWWCLRFCNAWGKLAQDFPENTLIVKYEDLKSDPLQELQRINSYWQLEMDEPTLNFAISESSKEKMTLKKDPDTPFGVTVVIDSKRAFIDWFDSDQIAFFNQTRQDLLKYDFDYDYKW